MRATGDLFHSKCWANQWFFIKFIHLDYRLVVWMATGGGCYVVITEKASYCSRWKLIWKLNLKGGEQVVQDKNLGFHVFLGPIKDQLRMGIVRRITDSELHPREKRLKINIFSQIWKKNLGTQRVFVQEFKHSKQLKNFKAKNAIFSNKKLN